MGLIAAWSIIVVVGLIALMHFLWMLGVHWPGSDSQSLARTVIGSEDQMPALPVQAGATAFFFLLASLPYLYHPELGHLSWLKWPVGLAAFAFLLRGVGGIFDESLRPEIKGTPYCRLNRRLYSPLALVIGLLYLLVMLEQSPG